MLGRWEIRGSLKKGFFSFVPFFQRATAHWCSEAETWAAEEMHPPLHSAGAQRPQPNHNPPPHPKPSYRQGFRKSAAQGAKKQCPSPSSMTCCIEESVKYVAACN